MTTPNLTHRPAAPRKFAGKLLLRLSCCAALCAAALPAFAQDADAAAVPTAPAVAAAAPIISDAMPMPERALIFAGDVNRMIGARPVAIPTAELPSGNRIQIMLKHALALLGTPYRWGGTSTQGFDCSGLVGYVFQNTLGIELPRISRDMAKSGELVSERSKLTAGDLVFFGRKGRVNHVGIYVGEGQFVHAPRTGKDVMVSRMDSGYWSNKYLEGRRVAGI